MSFDDETQGIREKIIRFSRCAFQFILWAYPGIWTFIHLFNILSADTVGQSVSQQGLIAGGAGQSADQTGLQSDFWTDICQYDVSAIHSVV